MRRLLLLAGILTGVLAWSGLALAWNWTPVGPRDTKTQYMNGAVRVMFTPGIGLNNQAFGLYKHQLGDGRTFNHVATVQVSTDANGTITGVTYVTGTWGWDTTYGYVYYEDTNIVDYQEYYYFVTPGTLGAGNAFTAQTTDLSKLVVARAFPPGQTRHGEFSEYTNACTGCHGLHSSVSQLGGYGKLLKAPTQTDLCATCHDGSGSKYDLLNGRVFAGNGYANSPAGPFGNQLKNALASDPVTSKHNVYSVNGIGNVGDGSPSATAARIWQAPGSGYLNAEGSKGNTPPTDPLANAWANKLICTSCHEPHNKYKNFRLLRGDFSVAGIDPNGSDNYQLTSGAAITNGVDFTELVIRGVSEVNPASGQAATMYLGKGAAGDFTSDFCLACHRAWNDFTSGTNYPGVWGSKRHPFGNGITPALLPGTRRIIDDTGPSQSRVKDWNGSNYASYVPLEGTNTNTGYTSNAVVCLTCHVAHGTTKAAGGFGPNGQPLQLEVAYRNYLLNNTAQDVNGNPLTRDPVSNYLLNRQNGVIYGSSSVLARFEPFASVCYRCHSTR